MSLDKVKMFVGDSAILSWQSTNATSCSVTGVAGAGTGTSGRVTITATAGGQFTYSVQCLGAGGSATKELSLIVPMPVLRSSYENKVAAGETQGPQNISPFINSSSEWISTGYAFADFFGEGEYSLVTASLHSSVSGGTPDLPTTVKFWKKRSGQWVDNTAGILSDQVGCIGPRKAMVADLNNDKRPDVIFACAGIDLAPFSGEKQRILLSQDNGTYKNIELPFNAFAHGGSAADLSRTGYADIVFTDTAGRQMPFLISNNGDGTFAERQQALAKTSTLNQPIYSAELFDKDGDSDYDLWVAGASNFSPSNNFAQTIYENNGSNIFYQLLATSYPRTGIAAGAIDMVFRNGKLYTLWTHAESKGVVVTATSLGSNDTYDLYTHIGNYPNGTTWFPWLIFYGTNIVASDSTFGVTIPY